MRIEGFERGQREVSETGLSSWRVSRKGGVGRTDQPPGDGKADAPALPPPRKHLLHPILKPKDDSDLEHERPKVVGRAREVELLPARAEDIRSVCRRGGRRRRLGDPGDDGRKQQIRKLRREGLGRDGLSCRLSWRSAVGEGDRRRLDVRRVGRVRRDRGLGRRRE